MTAAAASQYQALILGGGDPGDPFAVSHGVAVKGLVPVAGQPMGLHVLRAVRASGQVGRVAYIGPTTPEMDALIDLQLPDRGSLLDNLTAGLEALGDRSGRALVLTADIPMLTAQQLNDVLAQAAEQPGAGLLYPVVPREACERTFPGVKRTFVRVKDGTFTGGNLFLFDPALVGQFLPRLRAVLDARKAPLKLAALIGPGVLLRLLTGQLTVRGLEEAVSRLLGVQARAIITPHAAVGTDVDKPSDLALAEAYLSQAQ
ncbi:nucleotide-diphospho-sugar transferase [Deinococcus piscis]|uniref:Nucleotide-diphospho-sugar transferase n=1 Tax=Deinococcus piscis TaxID=394230 RepID=A0ABQ3JZZ8_9DEIO|nr:NTP transferase domain-containing protein [Deinococcus piscis]GHF95957.1 nucleotide-diphospho-sugar transferase [Deinococcus piscis]